MKKNVSKAIYSKTRYRVDVQVFIMTAVIVIVSCTLTFLVSYRLSYGGMINELRERANSIHEYSENELDMNAFSLLNSSEDVDTQCYGKEKEFLERIRKATGVRYLYTAKQAADGEFIYLIDGLDATDSDFRTIGDLIEPECIPDMEKAMENKVVLPRKITHTSWGDIFIAYFPMHDRGKVVGVLGIEFEATKQYQTYRNMWIAAPVIICLFCLIAALIAVLMFRRISNPAYKDMANTDMLTGLKNRNAFEVELNNIAGIKEKRHIALVSVDLDKLKQVNDTWGHSAGDDYIKKGSMILEQCLPPNGLLYRVGGDEFAVLFPDIEEEELKCFMDYLKKQKEDFKEYSGKVSLSAGCAFFDAELDQTLEDTFKRADANMYGRKQHHKNNVREN